MRLSTSLLLLPALCAGAAFAAPIVHTSDFIATNTRTALVDFEPIGDTASGAPSFSQSGVDVNQRNGDGNDIWTNCASSCFYNNTSRSWYPNFGDTGWTEISKSNGTDFASVGVEVVGSILFGYSSVQYELLDNGVRVLLGEFTYASGSDGYLGFSGGGFDLIRLRATPGGFAGANFGNGAFQALAIDNIELANAQQVPEPGVLALSGLALVAGALTRRRRKTA